MNFSWDLRGNLTENKRQKYDKFLAKKKVGQEPAQK